MVWKILFIILIGSMGVVSLSGCDLIGSFQKEKAIAIEKRKEFKMKILKELSKSDKVISFLKEARDKYKVVDLDDYIYLAWIFNNSKNKVFNSELLHVFIDNQTNTALKQDNITLDMKNSHMLNAVHYFVFLKEKGYDDVAGAVNSTNKSIEESMNTPVDFLNILKEVNPTEYERVVERRIKMQKKYSDKVKIINDVIKKESGRFDP